MNLKTSKNKKRFQSWPGTSPGQKTGVEDARMEREEQGRAFGHVDHPLEPEIAQELDRKEIALMMEQRDREN